MSVCKCVTLCGDWLQGLWRHASSKLHPITSIYFSGRSRIFQKGVCQPQGGASKYILAIFLRKTARKWNRLQWRIQDVPEEVPPGGANIQFCQNFLKTPWNQKNLYALGGGVACVPLRSANGLVRKVGGIHRKSPLILQWFLWPFSGVSLEMTDLKAHNPCYTPRNINLSWMSVSRVKKKNM